MTNHNHKSGDQQAATQSCAAIRDLLPKYVTQEVLGQHPSSAEPFVTTHCASCPSCRAALDELRRLMLTDDPPSSPEPPPQFNLFFLRPPEQARAPQPPRWQIDSQGRLVFTFAQVAFQHPAQVGFAGARRGPNLYSFDLKLDPPHGFNVLIKVVQSRHEGDGAERLVDVEVNVEVVQASPLDQSGSEVVVAADTFHRRDTTNLAGLARFTDLPLRALSELRIEVLPRSALMPRS